ncbi:MAG: D-alanine--D-alanine ligase [Candidatus Taylorbacteria bacterium]
MSKTRVGVLRGGPSTEYEVSLKSGSSILSTLRDDMSDRYHAIDIFIDKKGLWHIDGVAVTPEQVLKKVDVIFNALHGAYGEDGTVQALLDTFGIPYTGSQAVPSAMGMNKQITNSIVARHGVKVPLSKEIPSHEILADVLSHARAIFNSFPIPVVVKPTSGGSSVGVTIAQTLEELTQALSIAAALDRTVLVQEYIKGIEATCGVIEHFRNEHIYALPPVEIRPAGQFFDYESKYSESGAREIVPATFSDADKRTIEALARTVHSALGLRHYSRSDFIIHPRRGVYFLEVNTLPGLTSQSLFPKALASVGGKLHELADHLIKLSLKLV